MPKPEWGVKRTCPSCGVRFYDLGNMPITCPSCGESFDLSAKDKAADLKADLERAKKAEAAQAELVDDEDLTEDVDNDDDDAAVVVDDDDSDDDDAVSSPALSDEDSEDEPVEFDDDVLLDDDEDDDDIEDLGDVPTKGGEET